MFPIFPVDYPFIEKGHRFTMDTNIEARPNALRLVRELERTGQVIAGTAGVPPAMSAKREKRIESFQKPARLRRVAGETPAVPADNWSNHLSGPFIASVIIPRRRTTTNKSSSEKPS